MTGRHAGALGGLALLMVLAPAGAAHPAERFVDTAAHGSGDCSTAANACVPGSVWSPTQPGDTVTFAAGTSTAPKAYQGATNMIVPPSGKSGASSAPITLRCAVDGGCLIDGQFVRRPLDFSGNNWYVIEGFNFRNGALNSLGKQGQTMRFTNSSRNIIRRVVAWDTPISQGTVIAFIGGSSFNLLEDSAGFGTGRKILLFIDNANDNIVRRFWARSEGATANNGMRTISMIYKAYRNVCENCLATASWESQPEAYDATDVDGNIVGPRITNFRMASTVEGALGVDHMQGVTDPCADAHYLGSLAYFTATDRIPRNASGAVTGFGLRIVDMRCFTIRHTAVAISPSNPDFSVARAWRLDNFTSGAGTFSAHNITSIRASGSQDSFGGNWDVQNLSAGTALGSVASPWTAALNGPGANLCHRTVNGVRTNEPLFPWPMNQRIKDATAMAGAYTGPCPNCVGGRFARTATDVQADIEALLGPIPPECRGETGPTPPQSTGLLVRYFLDEADTGQGPSAALDSSGVGTAVNLAHTYQGGQPNYTGPPTGRGLDWSTAGGDGGPNAAIDGTKVKSTLQGKQRLTLVTVANLTALAATPETLSDCRLAISLTDATTLNGTFNGTTTTWEGLSSLTGGRKVIHVVYDTTQATPADRVRLYIGGVDQGGFTAGAVPAQSEALDLQTGRELSIGNRPEGDLSPDGIISFSAIHDQAFTAAQVSTDATALATSDDAGGGGGGEQPAASIVYDGFGTWAGSASNATLTPGLPPNPSAGRMLHLILASRTNGSAPSWSGLSGWTQVGTTCHQTGTRNIALAVYRKMEVAGELAPAVTISDVGLGHTALVVAYRNQDGTTPIDVTPVVSSSAAATTWTPTGLTTATNEARVISLVATPDLSTITLQTAQGFTALADPLGLGHGAGPHAINFADLTQATAGAVTMPTWQQGLNGPDEWCGITWALRLAGQTPTPPPQHGGGNAPILQPLVTDKIVVQDVILAP